MDYYSAQMLLMFIAVGLAFLAQSQVQGKYAHFSKIETVNGITGYQVARRILDSKGLQNVDVQVSQRGLISDHYDPKTNTVNLSPKVYHDASIASVAIAAHEVGHAIQYAENYSIVGIRNLLLPAAITSGNLGWIVCGIGAVFSGLDILFWVGLAMLGVVATFQLITLPLEFNASSRALQILEEENYINIDEVADSRSMLNAAAMTYVAALLVSLLQIMRFIVIRGGRRR